MGFLWGGDGRKDVKPVDDNNMRRRMVNQCAICVMNAILIKVKNMMVLRIIVLFQEMMLVNRILDWLVHEIVPKGFPFNF